MLIGCTDAIVILNLNIVHGFEAVDADGHKYMVGLGKRHAGAAPQAIWPHEMALSISTD